MATALLITESYPLGGLTEEAFVLPEIKALGEVFDKVVVAPVTRRGVAAADSMPANVIIATDIADSARSRQKMAETSAPSCCCFKEQRRCEIFAGRRHDAKSIGEHHEAL